MNIIKKCIVKFDNWLIDKIDDAGIITEEDEDTENHGIINYRKKIK